MKLILYIRNRIIAEVDLRYPDYGDMNFETKCELNKTYIDLEIQRLKNEYHTIIQERPWQIILVAGSRVNKLLENITYG